MFSLRCLNENSWGQLMILKSFLFFWFWMKPLHCSRLYFIPCWCRIGICLVEQSVYQKTNKQKFKKRHCSVVLWLTLNETHMCWDKRFRAEFKCTLEPHLDLKEENRSPLMGTCWLQEQALDSLNRIPEPRNKVLMYFLWSADECALEGDARLWLDSSPAGCLVSLSEWAAPDWFHRLCCKCIIKAVIFFAVIEKMVDFVDYLHNRLGIRVVQGRRDSL